MNREQVKKDLAFHDWMQEVDAHCERNYGLSVHDLPDCCFRDWFDSGVRPKVAAARARKAAE